MDVTILLIAASTIVVLIIATLLLKNRFKTPAPPPDPQPRAREAPGPRRAQTVRNARQRMRANVPAQDSDEDDEDAPEKDDIKLPSGKMGTKKRAKLEAKAERKAHLEAEERLREERKKRQAAADEERKQEDEREKAEEEARLAEEKRLREEKEKKEHEEYLKLKSTFSVAEEGYEQGDNEDEATLLQDFINYIKTNKVVILEDLAAHFKLKTQNVIDRIQDFQANGTLTGVIDDRGKFIYISEEELQAVANFVKQRGRVSISELADSSNQLISLTPMEITT